MNNPNQLVITTLDGLRVQCGGEPVEELASRKVEALLVYLACTNRKHSREVLGEMFWEGRSQERTMGNLRVALSSLRKCLGDYVDITREAVGINPDANIQLDVVELEARVAKGQFEDALDLYKGEFLRGFHVRGARRFEDWQLAERERIKQSVEDVLQELVSQSIEREDYKTGMKHARRFLQLNPLSETAHRNVMLLLTYTDKREEALAQYDMCLQTLEAGLGVEPSEETRLLRESIAKGEIVPTVEAETPHHNLPIRPTSFIGREKELSQIASQLGEPACRLLTLVGVGGIGKTSLAIKHASEHLDHYFDGVWIVELASMADPDLVPQQVASVFGVTSHISSEDREEDEVLFDYLKDKRLLVVMDNCEHLIEASADFAARMLSACPFIKLIVTSRETLAIPGEHVYQVPALSLPPDESAERQLETFEAVRLFIERAVSVNNEFKVTDKNKSSILDICRILDGIPLAIELAAARVNVLALNQIAERLEDQFELLRSGHRTVLPRHQTLQAAMDWSYELLTEEERSLLRQLSVFSGGWTLESVERVVIHADKGKPDYLDELARLVDKSLVVVEGHEGSVRYKLLETVRQYASMRLAEAGEAARAHRKHALYFLALAEDLEPRLRGFNQMEFLDKFEAEHENLRSALRRALENKDADLALRLTASLGWFWLMRGCWQDVHRWLPMALDLKSEIDPLNRARAIYKTGGLEIIRVNLIGTEILIEEALGICREVGNDEGIAWCLNLLGMARGYSNDEELAHKYFSESVELFRKLGDEWGIAWSTRYLSFLTKTMFEYKEIITLQKDAISRFEALGDLWNAAHSLYLLGSTAFMEREFEEAEQAHSQSLAMCESIEDEVMGAHAKRGLGEIALIKGELREAESIFHETLDVFQRIGDENCASETHGDLAVVMCLEGDFNQAKKHASECLEGYKRLGRKTAVVWSIVRFAQIARSMGDVSKAVRLLGFADAWYVEESHPLAPYFRTTFDELVNSSKEALGEEAFEQAWSAGCQMDMEGAIAYAMKEFPSC